MNHWLTQTLVACFLAACIATVGGACGGPPGGVVKGASVAQHGLDDADALVTEQFAELWPDALREADEAADLAQFESSWNRVRKAIGTAYEAVHSLTSVIDAWDEVSRERKMRAVSHALRALRDVGEALIDAGVDLPEDLAAAIGLLGGFLGEGS